MSDNEIRLTGGIVFSLILEILTPQKSLRNYHPKDNIKKESTYFIELLEVLIPNPSQEQLESIHAISKETVSKYKLCQSEGSGKFPFNTPAKRSLLKSQVIRNYELCLEKMETFISQNINTTGNAATVPWLKEKLIELLISDSTISDESLFYINKDATPSRKCDITKSLDIDLSAFLLGFWLMSCCHPKGNKLSKEVYAHFKELIAAPQNNDDETSDSQKKHSTAKRKSLIIDKNDLPLDPDDVKLLNEFIKDYDELIEYHINIDLDSPPVTFKIDLCAPIQFHYEEKWESPYRKFKNKKLDKIREYTLNALNTINEIIVNASYLEYSARTGCLHFVFWRPIDMDYYEHEFKPTYKKMQGYLKKLKSLIAQFTSQ